jgi:hypothetical protein
MSLPEKFRKIYDVPKRDDMEAEIVAAKPHFAQIFLGCAISASGPARLRPLRRQAKAVTAP